MQPVEADRKYHRMLFPVSLFPLRMAEVQYGEMIPNLSKTHGVREF